MSAALDLIRQTFAAGDEHLGDIIFWSLADARIDRQTLLGVWTGAGLSADLLPEEPTAEKAFKSAIKEAQVGHPDRLLRLAKEDAGEVVFAVVHEQRHPDGRLTYSQEARLALDRSRGQVSSDDPHHDLAVNVQARYQQLLNTHTPDDVRRALVRALDSFAAVTLRDSGGIYWVPQPYAGRLRQLQSAIEKIGSSRVYLVPVYRTTEAEKALGEVAQASIEAELASLKAEIEAFLISPPERASTLVRRFDAFEELRKRAGLYKTVLSAEVQDLDQQLDRLAAAVEMLLDQKSHKPAA